jgi:hypothetical protein
VSHTSTHRRRSLVGLGGLALVLGVAAVISAPRIAGNLATPDPGEPVAEVVDDARPSELDPNTVPQDGADYARLDGDRFLVCDREADENLVKGVLQIAEPDGDGSTVVEVADGGGADGRCVAITVTGRVINLRVCERNVLAWHCSNAQSPVPFEPSEP